MFTSTLGTSANTSPPRLDRAAPLEAICTLFITVEEDERSICARGRHQGLWPKSHRKLLLK